MACRCPIQLMQALACSYNPLISAFQPQLKLDPNNFFGKAKCPLCCLPIKALQKLIWHPHAHHRRLWMANERGRGRDGKKDATFEMGSALVCHPKSPSTKFKEPIWYRDFPNRFILGCRSYPLWSRESHNLAPNLLTIPVVVPY